MYFWLSVILILALTVLAVLWAMRARRRRLEKRLRLEISNQGNTESRYQLQAEDLTGGLRFHFLQDGSRLPELVVAGPTSAPVVHFAAATEAQPVEPAGPSRVERAMGFSGALASLLVSIGSILPGSLGRSLSQSGSQLSRSQSQASRIQQVSNQAAAFTQTGGQPGPRSVAVAAPQPEPTRAVNAWAETPLVQPGGTLLIDLEILSDWAPADVSRPFLLKSRSTSSESALLVAEDYAVQVKGGFWSHRAYPLLLISAISILSMGLAYWFTWS